jgi:3',5'-cyclic AMP phosphodiesterase CpdA
VLGALFFLLPAAAVLSRYLPHRIADVRRLTAAARAIGLTLTPERERTLAMRAAYGLPYERLVRYTRDPLADLESGRYDGLVAAALDDAGLRPSRFG